MNATRSQALPERTIGIEMEYTLQDPSPGASSCIEIPGIISEGIKKLRLAKIGSFLSNGSKLYSDVAHLEYATQESLGPVEAAISDLAGRRIVQNLVKVYNLKHDTKIALFRTSGTYVEDKEATKGFHENYEIERRVEKEVISAGVVASHLASKQWAGIGGIRNGEYVLSQKVWSVGAPITRGYADRITHGKKPLACVPTFSQDDDTMKDGLTARLETRSTDPIHNFELSSVSLASTSLVLRLHENKHIFDQTEASIFSQLSFVSPINVAKESALDKRQSNVYIVESGKYMSTLDMQESLIELCEIMSARLQLPDQEVKGLSKWRSLIDLMRAASRDEDEGVLALDKHLDCAVRYKLLKKYISDVDCPIELTSDKLVKKSLAWDCVLPNDFTGRWWSRVAPLSNDEQAKIGHRQWHAPKGTRASSRGDYVKAHSRDSEIEINWNCAVEPNGCEVVFKEDGGLVYCA